jgi:hypothetical protein
MTILFQSHSGREKPEQPIQKQHLQLHRPAQTLRSMSKLISATSFHHWMRLKTICLRHPERSANWMRSATS